MVKEFSEAILADTVNLNKAVVNPESGNSKSVIIAFTSYNNIPGLLNKASYFSRSPLLSNSIFIEFSCQV